MHAVTRLITAGGLGWMVMVSTIADQSPLFFEKEILPILKQRCYECHSHQTGKAKGGLVLDSRTGWENSGSGPVIIPGKLEESLLIQAVSYGDQTLQMPPDQKLSRIEIESLEEWVVLGAPDPRTSQAPAPDPAA